MMITSVPIASRTTIASAVERVSPPKAPLVARDRMKTPSSRKWRCMRIRSPKMAPPVKGLVGSMASTPTVLPSLRNLDTTQSTRVDLPTPGEPVNPITYAFPARGYRSASSAKTVRSPSSILLISRAVARTLSLIAFRAVTSGYGPLWLSARSPVAQ